MSSSSCSKCSKSRNLKLCAQDAGGWANSGRTRRNSSSGSAPSRCRCVSVFGRDWTKLKRSGELIEEGDRKPHGSLAVQSAFRKSAFLQKLVGIQLFQRRRREQAVLANQFVVEPDFAAAPLLALDADHVPVHDRLVAVAGTLVSLAGREMEGSGDLLVEEDVAHRVRDVRIKANGEFPDVARACVGIENLVQALRIVGGGLDDSALLENEPDVVERRAEIDGRRVVLDDAFDAVLHGAREHFG